MLDRTTDSAWERYGREDPYFGVLTDEKYRRARLTEAQKAEFFESGTAHVSDVIATIRRHIDSEFQIDRALDFGCGVGRLVIPLAAVARQVTGVDVSKSMLEEARRNCDARQLRNVEFVTSDDRLTLLKGPYNFVHSLIVFQHIPVERGRAIFRRLTELLQDGGVGVLHVTYAKSYRPGWKEQVKSHVPLVRPLLAWWRARRKLRPEMQMNAYDLNALFAILQTARIGDVYLQFTDHGGSRGVVLYFRKPPSNSRG